MAAIGLVEVAPGAGVLGVLCIFFTFLIILGFQGICIDIPESLDIGISICIGWHQIGSISIC